MFNIGKKIQFASHTAFLLNVCLDCIYAVKRIFAQNNSIAIIFLCLQFEMQETINALRLFPRVLSENDIIDKKQYNGKYQTHNRDCFFLSAHIMSNLSCIYPSQYASSESSSSPTPPCKHGLTVTSVILFISVGASDTAAV